MGSDIGNPTTCNGEGGSMANQNERTLSWHSFIYDVNRTTASLMYLLQGMEAVRAREIPPYDGFPSNLKYSFPDSPKPPGVEVTLVFAGPSFDPHNVLDPAKLSRLFF